MKMIRSETVEYFAVQCAKQRCTNPNDPGYPNYGGRGIQFKFPSVAVAYDYVLANIGPKPSPDHSIDRVNNDGHYEPGNLRWATRQDQFDNRRPQMPEERTKDAIINIRVKPEIKAAAVKKATEQNRTLTTYLEWLILQDTAKK
jgi:hypothetical protein